MSFNESLMGRANAQASAHARRQIKRAERGQQWYGRPAETLIRGQTLSFQHDWRSYWYAARLPIPYLRTGNGNQVRRQDNALGPRERCGCDHAPRKTIRGQKAYFAEGGGFARIRSLVWRHFEQEIQAQIKTEAGRKMALKCEFCGKAPHFGNVISHANNTRRRRWNPNLKRLRAVVAGVRKHVRVCTACIRAGKVKKAA
jgi:large subunit ribosomal protein L28